MSFTYLLGFHLINNFVKIGNLESLLTISMKTKLVRVNFYYFQNPSFMHFKQLEHILNFDIYWVYWCYYDHWCIVTIPSLLTEETIKLCICTNVWNTLTWKMHYLMRSKKMALSWFNVNYQIPSLITFRLNKEIIKKESSGFLW